MSERAQVVQGPWPSLGTAPKMTNDGAEAAPAANRMVLGFVVREPANAVGHDPSPRELADWANHQVDDRGEFCLFGRAISESEAAVILKHPAREVTVRPTLVASRTDTRPLGLPGRRRSAW